MNNIKYVGLTILICIVTFFVGNSGPVQSQVRYYTNVTFADLPFTGGTNKMLADEAAVEIFKAFNVSEDDRALFVSDADMVIDSETKVTICIKLADPNNAPQALRRISGCETARMNGYDATTKELIALGELASGNLIEKIHNQ